MFNIKCTLFMCMGWTGLSRGVRRLTSVHCFSALFSWQNMPYFSGIDCYLCCNFASLCVLRSQGANVLGMTCHKSCVRLFEGVFWLKDLLFSRSWSVTGVKMNKQPSKESLRDRVKGIFGLGTPRPHSKQTENKPSEFIITLDILMVRDAPTEHFCTSLWPCVSHIISLIPSFRSSLRTVASTTGSKSSTRCATSPNPRSSRRWEHRGAAVCFWAYMCR